MKNNKKKVLPLLLAGVLLLSAGAYGTRAYFTDSADQEVGIKLTLGDLEIKSENTVVWNYTPETGTGLDQYDINDKLAVNDGTSTTIMAFEAGKSVYPLATNITVSNVRPGDAFERTFEFTNSGSLTQKIAINDSELLAMADAPYTVTIGGVSESANILNGFVLLPGKSVTYTVRIAVSGLGTADTYNTKAVNDYVVDYLDEFLVISATQPNAN